MADRVEIYLKGSSNYDASVRLLGDTDTGTIGLPNLRLQILASGAWVDVELDTPAATAAAAVLWGAIGGTLTDQTDLVAALALKAPLASPALTGNPTAPTQTAANNSTRVATTAYADGAVATEATARSSADATLTTAAAAAQTTANAAAVKANNGSDFASAATTRTNLGLAIGTNVQAWDADLDTLAGLTAANALKTLRVNAGATAFEAVAFPGVIPAFYPGPSSANYYRSAHWTGNGTTMAAVANTVYMVPFKLEVMRRTWTLAGINVTTAVAGNGDITLWTLDPTTGKIGSTKVFAASITTGSTGIRTAVISATIEPGWYVARIIFDNASTVRGHATTLAHPWGMDATANSPLLCKTSALGGYTTNPGSPEDIASGFTDNTTAAPTLYLQ